MRRHCLWLLGATFALALTFSDLLHTDRVPIYRDIPYFVLPLKATVAARLRDGSLPLWNPWIYLGTPLLAGFQSAVFYPLTLLLLLPFPLGFNLFLFSHYLIALTGTYLFLSVSRRSSAASTVGALVFAAGGTLVSLLSLTNHLQGLVWLPWILLVGRKITSQSTSSHRAILVVLILIQLLAGSPEASLVTLVLLAAQTITYQRQGWREFVRSEIVIVWAATLAGGMAAIQLIPTLEYVAQSKRSGSLPLAEVTYWSFKPISLLQLLLPHSSALASSSERAVLGPALESPLPFLQSIYLGVVPLCLLPAGISASGEGRFWGCVLMTAVLLALGRHGTLFPLLYQAAPGVIGRFRYPEKFLFAAHFAAAVIAAAGADALWMGSRLARRLTLISGAALLAFGCLVHLIGRLDPDLLTSSIRWLTGANLPLGAFAPNTADVMLKSQRLVLLVGAFLAVLLLYGRRTLRGELLIGLTTLLTAADVASVHRNLNLSVPIEALERSAPLVDIADLHSRELRIFHYQTVSAIAPGLGDAEPIPGLAPWRNPLSVHEDLRAFTERSWRALYLDIGMLYGVATVLGFDGIERRSNELLESVLAGIPRSRAITLLRALGVGALVGPTPLEDTLLEPVAPPIPSPDFVYRMRNPVPFVRLVEHLREVAGEGEALDVLLADDFDPFSEATVEHVPAGWRDRSATAPPVKILVRDPERIVLETTADEPALLIVNESFYPGWEVAIDDRSEQIVRTNGFFRGVFVPAGSHTIDFAYRPVSLRWGAALSAIFGVVFAGSLALGRRDGADR